jgi:hypothetical protein
MAGRGWAGIVETPLVIIVESGSRKYIKAEEGRQVEAG